MMTVRASPPTLATLVVTTLAVSALAAMATAAAPATAAARARVLDDAKGPRGAMAEMETPAGGGSDVHRRVRRQNGEVVESIFQIPIQTLMAVSKVFTTSIQSVQRMREQFFQATRPTGSGGSSSAVYNYQQQLQQLQQQKPNRPNRPYRPSAGAQAGAGGSGGGSSSAFASAYTTLNRPVYYPGYVLYNYNRPRSGAQQQQQSHAASVAGVSTQGDGSSYRI